MKQFQTESKKLLDLMINSIYTNKEIFLRELISNASDAVDKLYFKSLTDTSIAVSKDDLSHRCCLSTRDARTITVSDTGIGMTRDELEPTWVPSPIPAALSSRLKRRKQGEDVDIIGQFGVGFYSSFMVAKEVTVTSRAYGEAEAFTWKSDGIEGYTIEPATAEEAAALGADHGTSITLHLKDNADEEEYDVFLDQYELQALIKQYSNYVRYPIRIGSWKNDKPLPKPARCWRRLHARIRNGARG